MSELIAYAKSIPGVAEGIACAGTALESRTYLAGKKTFLFVSAKEARLKLAASAPEARKAGFEVGANGWVKLPLGALPPAAVCKRWIAESHALAAGTPVAAKPSAKSAAKPLAKSRAKAAAGKGRGTPPPRGARKPKR